MKELKAFSLLILACLVQNSRTEAQLVINEFMQSNVETIMDDINEFPDSWVELYNAGTEPVDLSLYSIATDEDAAKAYQLPSAIIPPDSHIVVYCDKEANGMHSDFRLESGKNGAIYLFQNGQLADKITKIAKMPSPDVAYGRESDGAEVWGYQLTTTPGSKNEGGLSDIILGKPIFSPEGGVYENASFNVTLSLPADAPADAVIRFTTDGSEPTESSSRYSEPLSLSSSTVIRAKIFAPGAISPVSTAQSYLSLGRKVSLPVVSLAINSSYLDDNNIGIFANNNSNSSVDWRRPVNFEFFPEPETPSALNQLCETRVSGGASRGVQFKSQLIYANKRFGEKRLDYEFFPNSKPGLTDFKSIMLRNAGNDFDYLYFRDAAIQINMAQHCDIDWQAYQPVIIFINGQYRGMLNIRERSNEDNIYSNYDGLEDIDMFENWNELKTGSWDNYNEFKALYTKENVTFAELDKYMDISEFLNVMILNIFHNNLDFPGNNIVMWRPIEQDGKWRWVVKDTDFGLGLYGRNANYNYLSWLDNPNYDKDNNWANKKEHTDLYHALINTPEGRDLFLNKFIVYMGDFLNGDKLKPLLDSLYNNIKFEYPNHRNMINPWWPNHSEELRNARNWAVERTNNMWKHLQEKFSLGASKQLALNRLNQKDVDKCLFSYNDIPISDGTLKGYEYVGRHIVIDATPKSDDYKVVGWTVFNGKEEVIYKGSHLELDVNEDISSLTIDAIVRLSSEPDLEDEDEDDEEELQQPEVKPDDKPDMEPTVSPEDAEPSLELNGRHLSIENLKEGGTLSLYSLDGRLLMKHVVVKGPYDILLPYTGLYILKINGKSQKIFIQ
ncbi:MAG: CotH kinase family protein [Marinilabiliaceae bacterium]|nr:CotH kinase family protein [Marinilabiliaceae bacterium]